MWLRLTREYSKPHPCGRLAWRQEYELHVAGEKRNRSAVQTAFALLLRHSTLSWEESLAKG